MHSSVERFTSNNDVDASRGTSTHSYLSALKQNRLKGMVSCFFKPGRSDVTIDNIALLLQLK